MKERVADADGAPAMARRRQFLRATLGGTAGLAAWTVLGPGVPAARASAAAIAAPGVAREPAASVARETGTGVARETAARTIGFNAGWLFGPAAAGSNMPGFDDSGFVAVTLPHTVVPLSWRDWDPAAWETVWTYRKHFDAPAGASGLRAFLDFSAAMTWTTITLNGVQVTEHLGGYLPFSTEITGVLQPSGNVLAATVDATFNLDVPPDRPAPYTSASVDFWQPGGIYRDVRLRLVPQLFLADVFAMPVNVLDASTRQLVVQVTVDAGVLPTGPVEVTATLLDGTQAVASGQVTVPLTGPGQVTQTVTLSGLGGITLWDIDQPQLYTVIATLLVNGVPQHEHQVRIGFREAAFTLDGFYLNGRRVQLFGVNRHQFFPFAGAAMPARVQARDADIIRYQLNANMVRCSHYPQAEAFYDRCDEIGLLAWEEAPGWDYVGDEGWQALATRDVGDMIVRDRNHPSVIVWGARLNECPNDTAFWTSTNELAHALDPSRPTTGAMAGLRTTTDFQQDVFGENDYSFVTDAAGIKQPTLAPPVDGAGRPYLVSESVGTLSGPAIYYRRTDPQAIQQGQATAHATVHDLAAGDDRYCGLLAWSGFDYPSGNGNQDQGVKFTGVADLFRIPKLGAAIYQAQIDPGITPVIAPAFYWDFGPVSPATGLATAMICANLDRLEVYVGGAHFATLTPDRDDYPDLAFPPSFADFTTVDGSTRPDLRIDGYLGDIQVASRSMSADPAGDQLILVADDQEIDGDGSDATRVVFRAVDRYGAPRPYVTGDVTLDLDGPGVLVGDNPFDFAAAGGAGAAWIRSLPGTAGSVTVRASHPTLGGAATTIRVLAVPQSGRPVPSGTLRVQAVPAVVPPGASTIVTATLSNNGVLRLDAVTFTVTVADGWTARPIIAPGSPRPGTTPLPVGRSAQQAWQVFAPTDANPGDEPVAVQAAYTAQGLRGVSNGSIGVLSAFATLAAAYDNTGISDDSAPAAADFDGTGNSYSQQALTAAGLGPGAVLTHDGLAFAWPDVPAGQPDNVVAAGQTILVSGSGTTLGFLGAAAPGDAGGAGIVYYSDGTSTRFRVTLGEFLGGPAPGNDVVATMPYTNEAGGRKDVPGYILYASVPITPGKTVQALRLPDAGSGLHIFAVAIGPLSPFGASPGLSAAS